MFLKIWLPCTLHISMISNIRKHNVLKMNMMNEQLFFSLIDATKLYHDIIVNYRIYRISYAIVLDKYFSQRHNLQCTYIFLSVACHICIKRDHVCSKVCGYVENQIHVFSWFALHKIAWEQLPLTLFRDVRPIEHMSDQNTGNSALAYTFNTIDFCILHGLFYKITRFLHSLWIIFLQNNSISYLVYFSQDSTSKQTMFHLNFWENTKTRGNPSHNACRFILMIDRVVNVVDSVQRGVQYLLICWLIKTSCDGYPISLPPIISVYSVHTGIMTYCKATLLNALIITSFSNYITTCTYVDQAILQSFNVVFQCY